MNILRQAAPYAIAACFATAAHAQDPLSKEITVEKEIVPQEREASRLFQQPQLVLPAIQQKKLNWTDRAVMAPVTAGITVLPPNSYASTVSPSPYRGYADIGYFPSFQLGASAGYRFVDNESTRLGAWLQYDGSQYKERCFSYDKNEYKDHAMTLGADLSHEFENIGTLTAGIAYGLNSLNYPLFSYKFGEGGVIDDSFNQTLNRFGIDAGWNSRLGGLDIKAGVKFGHSAFLKPYPDSDMKALKNSAFGVSLGAAYQLSRTSTVGADIKYSSTSFSEHINVFLSQSGDFESILSPSTSYGVVELHPYFMSQGSRYALRLGVELTAQTGETTGVNIGPDVRLDWMPSNQFSLYAQARAGYVKLNTLSAMMDLNHYINPAIDYLPTRMKGQLDLGFVIGPFAGASFEAWGGIGSYENANMPVLYAESPACGMYMPMEFKSFNYGIAFNYNYRDIMKVRVSYEGAPDEHDVGYIEWQDRATSVIDASLTVTPIKPLDLTLSYRARSGRSVLTLKAEQAEIFKGYVYSSTDLSDANSLNFSAAYRINDRFTVWANAENLLGKKWMLTYGVPNVGLTGLVGIGYKF